MIKFLEIGKWPGVLLIGLILALASGCTRSTLYVESDPPGAEVFFDGQPKGKTPVEFDFTWYGGHKVQLRKEGYQEIRVVERLRAPLHYQVPLDFVTTVFPATLKDRQKRSYTLEPLVQTQDQDPEVSAP